MVNLQKALNYLFVSKVRIKCLKYFFFNQDIPIHLRAAARELGEEINAVRRELVRLSEIGLLKDAARGNRKYFSINPNFVFFDELTAMMFKSYGLGGELIKNQSKLGSVHFVGLTSSFVSGVRLDKNEIDLIVIGDVNLEFLSNIVDRVEAKLSKEINYTVLKFAEFNLRKKRKDTFITNLLLTTRVLLVGNREEFVM